jgi:ABC-type protease/lipase transport system fused ATPase/permease subunit
MINHALIGIKKSVNKALIIVFAFSFFINVLMLVPSIYMLQVYDRVLASRNITTLVMITLLVVFLYATGAALEWIRSKLLVQIGTKLEEQINEKVFTSAFNAILLREVNSGDPKQSISDLTNLRQFMTGQGVLCFFDAPWAPLYLTFS